MRTSAPVGCGGGPSLGLAPEILIRRRRPGFAARFKRARSLWQLELPSCNAPAGLLVLGAGGQSGGPFAPGWRGPSAARSGRSPCDPCGLRGPVTRRSGTEECLEERGAVGSSGWPGDLLLCAVLAESGWNSCGGWAREREGGGGLFRVARGQAGGGWPGAWSLEGCPRAAMLVLGWAPTLACLWRSCCTGAGTDGGGRWRLALIGLPCGVSGCPFGVPCVVWLAGEGIIRFRGSSPVAGIEEEESEGTARYKGLNVT
ncbi:hypothetical protein NDU88_002711 [Pleurodeles waltl]|uniref:Uncharacterized protein n=1 Tax=Pleurodeles waltl TaxID=8319 RepID=A0AAV7RE71_PLEWA|nr:hypothetical protein NDU88_002711 [Pleurodeles waltl]